MTQRLCRHPDQQCFRDVQEVTSRGRADFREPNARPAAHPYQLPGAAGGVVVVAWSISPGHIEPPGSATGLTSRPSAGMCPLTQVASGGLSRTAANIRSVAGLSALAVRMLMH
jgi:hypothetical protein